MNDILISRPSTTAALARRGIAAVALVTTIAVAGCGGTTGSGATNDPANPPATSTAASSPYSADGQGTDTSMPADPSSAAVTGSASADSGGASADTGSVPAGSDSAADATPEPGVTSDADRLVNRNLDQVLSDNHDRSMDSINQWSQP